MFHTLVPVALSKHSLLLKNIIFFLLLLFPVRAVSQDVTWFYPTSGLVVNYNDVVVATWTSGYAFPGLIVWAPNADGSAVVEWYHYISAWTNGTFAYRFSSGLDGSTAYPFSARFQLMSNITTTADGVNGDTFTVTSTSGLPKTYAFSTTITQTATTSAVAVSTATAGIASDASPYTYVGCWTDDSQDRTLVNQQAVAGANGGSNNMTVENCAALCYNYETADKQHYSIMGVEYGDECFCDVSIFNPYSSLASESDCNIPCTGDTSQNCGGVNRLNLYAINRAIPAWNASISVSITSPAATAGATSTSGSTLTTAVSTATTTPGSTSPTSTTIPTSSSSGLSTGAQAGIGAGVGVGGAILLAALGYFFWRRRRRSQQKIRNEYHPPPAYEAGGFTEPAMVGAGAAQQDMSQVSELASQGQPGVSELSAVGREPVELPPQRKS